MTYEELEQIKDAAVEAGAQVLPVGNQIPKPLVRLVANAVADKFLELVTERFEIDRFDVGLRS